MPAPPHRLGDYRDVDVVAVAAQADASHSLLVFVMPNNAHRRTALNTHGVSQLTCKHGGVDDTSGDSWRKREGALEGLLQVGLHDAVLLAQHSRPCLNETIHSECAAFHEAMKFLKSTGLS